jgi:2-iminobutanoate/2-iminopropanoate deaminase
MRTTHRITGLLLAMAAVAAFAAQAGKDVISAKDAPAAVGPYSQAVKAGNLVFLAGQLPLDPKTGLARTGSIEEQTTQVLDNLAAVLDADNMSMRHVVSTTVYVKNLDDLPKLNAIYAKYFKDKPPARATVQVQRLPMDVAVEISAIAVR